MQLITEIKNVLTLTVEQSQTIKGGARDTRGGKTTTTSTIRDDGSLAKK
jgi:hypothetical protein